MQKQNKPLISQSPRWHNETYQDKTYDQAHFWQLVIFLKKYMNNIHSLLRLVWSYFQPSFIQTFKSTWPRLCDQTTFWQIISNFHLNLLDQYQECPRNLFLGLCFHPDRLRQKNYDLKLNSSKSAWSVPGIPRHLFWGLLPPWQT